MKRRGTTIIELLFAISIITIGFFAVMKAIVQVGNETRTLVHRNESKLIAQRHLENDEAQLKNDFLSVSSKTWSYENDNPVYSQIHAKLTKQYFVKEDIEFEVVDATTSDTHDSTYKTRKMIDLDNNGLDDYTGQGCDMKKITVTVAWPEIIGNVSTTQLVNALQSGNQQFIKKKRIRYFSLSTIVSSFDPEDSSCCSTPEIDDFIITDKDGNVIKTDEQALNTSEDYTVTVALSDQCNAKIMTLKLYYWYYGENRDDNATELKMNPAGSNFYSAKIPGEAIINADNASGASSSETCSEEDPSSAPFDMFFQVYVKDAFIGNNCSNSSRESWSDQYPVNVADNEKPSISDSSLKNVKCHTIIRAKIVDGSNGVSGLQSVTAQYARMDADGNHGTLSSSFTSTSGPDANGMYTWEIPSSEMQNWSGGGGVTDFDDSPDLYYTISAGDNCGNSLTIPVDASDHSTEVTVTEENSNPPQITLNNDGNGFEDCVPYDASSSISIDYDVADDCEVTTTAYTTIPVDHAGDSDLSAYTHSFNVNSTWANIADSFGPSSRNDFLFRVIADDNNKNETLDPSGNPEYRTIHQGNALFFPNPESDPFIAEDVTLSDPYKDTITLSLENYRDGDIYLEGLTIDEPTFKTICGTDGNTTSAFPYVDRVTLETGSTTSVIWDWKTDYPTPGSRERAPVTLQFDQSDPAKILIKANDIVKLYIHFMDKDTDDNYAASPFSVEQCNFDLTLHSEQNKEYRCNNHYVFNTKSADNDFPPVANAGEDQHVMVGQPVLFDGRGSLDCDDSKDTLYYRWDFGDNEHVGPLQNAPTAWHTYDETFYKQEKAKQSPSDTEPVYINAILTVTDPSSESDTDSCIIILKSVGHPPKIDSFTCSDNGSDNITFDVDVTDPDDTMFNDTFNFGDNQEQSFPNESDTLEESHSYGDNGSYTCTVIVTDSCGNTDSASVGISCSKSFFTGALKCSCE